MMRAIACAVVVVSSAASSFAQAGDVSLQLEQTLLPRPALGGARFGSDIELDGDQLAVGAEFAQLASVYERNGSTWTCSAEIEPVTNETVQPWGFGKALALQGDTLVVAAPRTEFVGVFAPGVVTNDAGSAFVYTRDGNEWTLTQLITQPGGPAEDHFFGTDVALDGDTLMIASPGKSNAANQNGAVYVYERNGPVWAHHSTLSAANPHSLNSYGTKVLLEGDRAVVPALNANVGPLFRAGQVYTYKRIGGAWSQQNKLSSPEPVASAGFGAAVTLHAGRLIVSEPSFPAARIAEFDLSGESALLTDFLDLETVAPTAAATALVLHDDSLFVTCTDGQIPGQFALCHLERVGSSWGNPTTLSGGHSFAVLAYDGERLIVGDAYDDAQATNSGAVSILRVDLPPWEFVEAGTPGSSGLIPDLLADGELAPGSQNTLRLRRATPESNTTFVLGLTRIDANFKGGVLVPAPDKLAFGFLTDVNGELQLPFTWPADAPSGLELHVQAWISDALGPGGFASTNGVSAETP